MKAAGRRKKPVQSAFVGSTAKHKDAFWRKLLQKKGEYLGVYTVVEGMFSTTQKQVFVSSSRYCPILSFMVDDSRIPLMTTLLVELKCLQKRG